MSWLARLRNVFRADEVSEEIEREMAFHLAERTDDLVVAGASPEEARREAERRFGSDLVRREMTRERDVLVWLETLLGDFRYGLRGLRRSPVFGVAAVLTLAIGIGANTAVFTVLWRGPLVPARGACGDADRRWVAGPRPGRLVRAVRGLLSVLPESAPPAGGPSGARRSAPSVTIVHVP